MDKERRREQLIAVLQDLEHDISKVGVPDYVIYEVIRGKIKIAYFLLTTPPGVTYYDYNSSARAAHYLKARLKRFALSRR